VNRVLAPRREWARVPDDAENCWGPEMDAFTAAEEDFHGLMVLPPDPWARGLTCCFPTSTPKNGVTRSRARSSVCSTRTTAVAASASGCTGYLPSQPLLEFRLSSSTLRRLRGQSFPGSPLSPASRRHELTRPRGLASATHADVSSRSPFSCPISKPRRVAALAIDTRGRPANVLPLPPEEVGSVFGSGGVNLALLAAPEEDSAYATAEDRRSNSHFDIAIPECWSGRRAPPARAGPIR
jgi:hypothetical protein